MPSLTPRVTAELARDVYAVQKENELKLFLMRPEFEKFNKANQSVKILNAEVGSRLINTRDCFGVCATGGKGYENDIFLIFRGTTNANHKADWASNLRLGVEISATGMPVHIGFNTIFCSMLPDIKKFIASHAKANGTIHCIGHSLGGAVATLAADWITNKTGNAATLYTFGAPRPALAFFASRLTSKLGKNNIFRTYHATDPVPMVPIYPFVHPPMPGYGCYIPSNEKILSAEAHDMKKYVLSVKNSSWENLERRSPPYNVDSAVEEWLKSKMPVNSASPVTWQWINEGLIYVLKKVAGPALLVLQGAFIGAVTLADKIAWLLQRGVSFTLQAGELVFILIRKIMQALGMAVIKTTADLTQFLIKDVLFKLIERTNAEARRAIQKYI